MKLLAPILAALSAALSPAHAAPILGSAENFAVMGAATITNIGTSPIFGDIAVAPGSALTGAASITHTGVVHLGDAVASQAQADARNAYNVQTAQAFTFDLSGQDLGGMTLLPGIYHFSSAAQLTGTLTLNAQGQAGATFVFQIGSTLTTASAAVVSVINGVADESVFFDVGSSATLGTGTQFAGNILALQSITMTTGASIMCGRAIALVGAVTLDTSSVSRDCATMNFSTSRSDFGSSGFSGAAVAQIIPAAVPEPSAMAALAAGMTGLAIARLRRPRHSLAVTHPSV